MPGGVHVPSGILTGPREKLGQELGDPDGAGSGTDTSADNVSSEMTLLIELARE